MAGRPTGTGPVRIVATSATRVLAICGKCGKKLGGGFGADAGLSLGKLLRRAVTGAKGKRATLRIVETKCLGICPKGAVALLDSAEPGAVVIVARATSVKALCAGLDLPMAG
jgi:predicted metal-binding protein